MEHEFYGRIVGNFYLEKFWNEQFSDFFEYFLGNTLRMVLAESVEKYNPNFGWCHWDNCWWNLQHIPHKCPIFLHPFAYFG